MGWAFACGNGSGARAGSCRNGRSARGPSRGSEPIRQDGGCGCSTSARSGARGAEAAGSLGVGQIPPQPRRHPRSPRSRDPRHPGIERGPAVGAAHDRGHLCRGPGAVRRLRAGKRCHAMVGAELAVPQPAISRSAPCSPPPSAVKDRLDRDLHVQRTLSHGLKHRRPRVPRNSGRLPRGGCRKGGAAAYDHIMGACSSLPHHLPGTHAGS